MTPETKMYICLGVGIILFLIFVIGTLYEFKKITTQPNEEVQKFAAYLKEQQTQKEQALRQKTYKSGIQPSHWN